MRVQRVLAPLGQIHAHPAFLGVVQGDRKAALLAASDVFAMPVRRVGTSVEGFGSSYIEAGWFGVPGILGGDNHWARFLAPVLGHPHVHVSGITEALLMGSSVLAGLCGIGLAFYLYRLKPHLPALLATRLAWVHQLLIHKYYIDELYNCTIVRPTLAFSRRVLLRVIDLACIEGVVNGIPRAIGGLSEKMRRIQDGQVSHYLAWTGGGALVLLVVLLVGN